MVQVDPQRQTAADAVESAKKALDKQLTRATQRRKLIELLLKNARTADDKVVVEKGVHLRSYCDTLRDSMNEQVGLLDGVDVLTDEGSKLGKFLQNMTGFVSRIETAAKQYKSMKERTHKAIKGKEDQFDATVVAFLTKDHFAYEKLQPVYKALDDAIGKVS